MDAVSAYGQTLIEDPARFGDLKALGLDETLRSRLGRWRSQQWSTQIVDVERGQLLDVVEGRSAAGPCEWLARRPAAWLDAIRWATLDLSGPYRNVFNTMLPDAAEVAGTCNLVELANQRLDECGRRVQNDTLGHRRRKDDPLYRCGRFLTKADERLDEAGRSKLLSLLDAGDARGEVRTAWNAKEVIRSVYEHRDPDLAVEFIDRLGRDLQDESYPIEVRSLGRTLLRWRDEIAACYGSQVSNGADRSRQQLILGEVRRSRFNRGGLLEDFDLGLEHPGAAAQCHQLSPLSGSQTLPAGHIDLVLAVPVPQARIGDPQVPGDLRDRGDPIPVLVTLIAQLDSSPTELRRMRWRHTDILSERASTASRWMSAPPGEDQHAKGGS